MTNEQKQRIVLIEKIKKDTNTLQVNEIAEIFTAIFFPYFEISETGRAVKQRLNVDEYVRYCTGLCNSFLSTVYVSAGKSKEECQERLEEVNEANKDILVKEEPKDAKSFC